MPFKTKLVSISEAAEHLADEQLPIRSDLIAMFARNKLTRSK